MAAPRLKSTRAAERRKVDLAVKYQKQGKASGGGWINPKKARRALEARNLPLQRAPKHPQAGKKQRPGRRRSTRIPLSGRANFRPTKRRRGGGG